jgi:hypothetical protein
MIFRAPYPFIQDTMVMPEPLLGNSLEPLDTRDYRIMMDKTVYSYIDTITENKYTYSFRLTRMKSIEVIAFIEKYIGHQWKIEDHHGVIIFAYCTSDPKTLTTYRGPHTGPCHFDGYSINEGLTLDLEFEGA